MAGKKKKQSSGPSLLGSGMARRAAGVLGNRKNQIDTRLNQATGVAKKKK